MLAVMSFAVYGLIGLMPGDPIDAMIAADPELTSEDTERLKALYGLDRPVWERYLAWAGQALGGDFGHSRIYHRPALDLLAERLPHTVLLMGLAFALSVAIALPGRHFRRAQGKSARRLRRQSPLFRRAFSTPPFWLAIMAMLLFSVTLGWLPATGYPAAGDAGWLEAAAAPRPAGGRAGAALRRRHHTLCARVHARSAAPGLCAHRTRQGPLREPLSCAAMCSATR